MGTGSSKPQEPARKRASTRILSGNILVPLHIKVDDCPDSDFVWPFIFPKCSFCDGDAEYESTLLRLRNGTNDQAFRLCSGCWGSSHAGVWFPPPNLKSCDSENSSNRKWFDRLGWHRIFDYELCHRTNLARAKRLRELVYTDQSRNTAHPSNMCTHACMTVLA